MSRATACLSLLILFASPGASQVGVAQSADVSTARLSGEEIAAAVETLAATAQARYVDPAGGERIAGSLRANLANGRYATLSDPVELAARLSADLHAAVPDVHLRVAFEPNRSEQTMLRQGGGQQAAGPQPFGRIDPRSSEAIARTNYGFEALQRLDGNIGYMKINQFVPPEMSQPTARAAMDFLANSDAIVIDLRGNIGGSPDLVRYLISHFTGAEPVPLMTRYSREGDLTETLMTIGEMPGQLRAGTPLHVLIDRNTASAAEMFAYFVQQKGFGIVYGETSSGAGQGGNMLPIGSGLAAFIPFTRIVDGPGWEQTGIRPDVEIEPRDALDVAHLAALRQVLAGSTDEHARREREWALEWVEASSRPVQDQGDLARFEGQFGSRSFVARSGVLHLVGSRGREDALIRVSDTVFRTRSGRYSFVSSGLQQATTVVVESLSGTRSDVSRVS